MSVQTKLPPWFRQPVPRPEDFSVVRHILRSHRLHTVCEEALCPNRRECWQGQSATFMILGRVCSRSCRFCAVANGRPEALDHEEPERIASAVEELGLKYVVITSVTRDDLPDGGSGHFARTIRAIRQMSPRARIEVLVPDFNGDPQSLGTVLECRPDVLGHNMETAERLSRVLRPQSDYQRSLRLLRTAQKVSGSIFIKSGFMVGIGETPQDVRQLMKDLKEAGCDILTIGQYLAPSKSARHVPVARFVTPEEFAAYHDLGLSLGFQSVHSAPLVRSSYMAQQSYEHCRYEPKGSA